MLLEAFDAESDGSVDGSLLDLEKAAGKAPKRNDEAASSVSCTAAEERGSSPVGVRSFTAPSAIEGERRRAVVDPILKAKQWTINKWGTMAGVGKNCAYEYLRRKRNLTPANRLALAQVLELKAEDLP